MTGRDSIPKGRMFGMYQLLSDKKRLFKEQTLFSHSKTVNLSKRTSIDLKPKNSNELNSKRQSYADL